LGFENMSRILAISSGAGMMLALSGCGGGVESCIDMVESMSTTVTSATGSCSDGKFCESCGTSDKDDILKGTPLARDIYENQMEKCKCTRMDSSVALLDDDHTATTFSTV